MVDTDEIRRKRREALQSMLADDPDDTFALYGLALEYKVQQELSEAQQLLKRTIELNPEHVYAYYQLGEVLMALGDDDDAERVLSNGADIAQKLGDTKALGELRALIDLL